ncbi:superinfection immunity protein [Mycobacterium avium subsp. hominissuis]|jgi:hypothetical protein|uniref:superinfection immunity protein n=1 Tax=Mycobacterium avium TaxID=1764 RepID=UPI0007A0307D|nr:superinfection immunity protein [Mycobacterium avium]MCA4760893.1 superinfection immunity protein [Mycobacterium avium subsp. hominissuis]
MNYYSTFQYLVSGICWIALIAAYCAPTIVAVARKHRSVGSVAVVDMFLGWTIIGWVVALAMAFSGNTRRRDNLT